MYVLLTGLSIPCFGCELLHTRTGTTETDLQLAGTIVNKPYYLAAAHFRPDQRDLAEYLFQNKAREA